MTARARLPLPADAYDALMDCARLDSDALARTGVDVDRAHEVYTVLLTACLDVTEAWREMVDCVFERKEDMPVTHVYVREDGFEARRTEVSAADMRRLLYECYAWREMAASLLGCGTAPLEADYRAHVRGGMTGDEARAAVIGAHFVVRPSLVDRLFGGWR